MWVYKRSEHTLYTVGFYDPLGKWISESDWEWEGKAAQRVNYLNGGLGLLFEVMTNIKANPFLRAEPTPDFFQPEQSGTDHTFVGTGPLKDI